jgi:hypothetical protein
VGLTAAAVVLVIVVGRALDLFGPPSQAEPSEPAAVDSPPVPTGIPPENDPVLIAQNLRAHAKTACEAKAWEDCLELLGQAAAIDPDGEDADDLRLLRAQAEEGLSAMKKSELPD